MLSFQITVLSMPVMSSKTLRKIGNSSTTRPALVMLEQTIKNLLEKKWSKVNGDPTVQWRMITQPWREEDRHQSNCWWLGCRKGNGQLPSPLQRLLVMYAVKKKAGETKNIFWETNQDAVWPADRGGGNVRVLKGGPSAAVLRCYGPGLLGWSTECPPSSTQLAISRRGPTRVHIDLLAALACFSRRWSGSGVLQRVKRLSWLWQMQHKLKSNWIMGISLNSPFLYDNVHQSLIRTNFSPPW